MTGALLAVLLAAGPAKTAPAKAPSLRWERSFAAALEKAKTAGKPVMVDFWAEWCAYCHVLDRTTYRDPTVIGLSRRFLSVKINTEGSQDERRTAGRYIVGALPTVLFVSPEGRQLWRVNGYPPPDQFPGVIDEALRVASKVLAWEAVLAKNPDDPEALLGLGVHQFSEAHHTAEGSEDGMLPRPMIEDATALVERGVKVDKDRPSVDRKRARTVLAILRSYVGRFDDAEALYKEAVAIRPGNEIDAAAYVSLGELYIRQGKKTEARGVLKKAAEGYPNGRDAQHAKSLLAGLGQ